MVSAGFDPVALGAAVQRYGAVVRVLVASAQGSIPREAGTAMLVWDTGQDGTIGGGALEWEAARAGRALLATGAPWARQTLKLPLGPALGQCCGGAVTLLLERFDAAECGVLRDALAGATVFARPTGTGLAPGSLPLEHERARRAVRSGQTTGITLAAGTITEALAEPEQALWLYGAGHVGRAIVHAAAGLPLAITWIDTALDRFPDPVPAQATALVAADPARAVALAPDAALHLVLTYSHPLDLAICHAVLARPFRHLGLIGSASKRARFRSRLRDLGHGEAALARLACPIGDPGLGKRPAAIALGVLAELLRLERMETRAMERPA